MASHEDGSESHGHTAAAWTAVTIMLIGFAIGSWSMVIVSWPLFWIGGVGVVLLGAIVGKVMSMLGFGISVPMSQGSAADEPGAHAPGTQTPSINND